MEYVIRKFKYADDLSPSDFEIFVKDTFVAAGWTDAIITKVGQEYKHGDGGVDIFASKNKRRFAIEVKQRNIKTNVDVKALNQLVTGARLAGVKNMILVTNSYFTSEVEIRALRLGVELINRDDLQNLWIQKHSEVGRSIKPRKYQQTVINDCFSYYQQGKNRLLIEMATGLGKTYTAALVVKKLMSESDSNLRVLLISHQVEILLQAVTAFKNIFGLGRYSFSACFSGATPENTDFVFASFDTLYNQIKSLTKDHFDIVIIDEAHHTPARTYSEVVTNFTPSLLIGLTATPYRADNQDVLRFFGGRDGHIGKYDLAWALKHNRLAFPKYMVMLDDLDQSRIDQLQTGMSISDLDKRLFLHKKDEEVVNIIEQTIEDKKIETPKGLVFCRNIEHMKHLIQFFQMGNASMVHSKMGEQERRSNIRAFREGKIRYLLVCNLFNEGIDIPETNLLIFMRYTGSRTIWLQQLGRGLRKTPNKDYVHVLDFVGSLDRLNEIHELKKSVESIKVEKENLDKPPRDFQDTGELFVHDSTLDVTYSKKAAQVLELLKSLEFRLGSRQMLIDKLRTYYETFGAIPDIQDIESQLTGVSCDQISTHFDTYYQYTSTSIPEAVNHYEIKDKLMKFIIDFVEENHIAPSDRAISLVYKYKSLLEFSESDIRGLIGSDIDLLKSDNTSHAITEVENVKPNIGRVEIESVKEDCQQLILNKYAGKIQTPNDMKELTDDERVIIRECFKSEFLFIKLVKDFKN